MTKEDTNAVIEPSPADWRKLACDLCMAMRTDAGQITLYWAEKFLRERAGDISRLARIGVSLEGEGRALEIARDFIEQIAGCIFPDSEVNGEVIGEAQETLNAIDEAIGGGSGYDEEKRD